MSFQPPLLIPGIKYSLNYPIDEVAEESADLTQYRQQLIDRVRRQGPASVRWARQRSVGRDKPWSHPWVAPTLETPAHAFMEDPRRWNAALPAWSATWTLASR
jgi:hypothetical protein